MSALPHRNPYLTPEEYLAQERQAATKSEYWQGKTYALAGASRRHNLVIFNLAAALGAQLKHRPCEAYTSDMRVKVTSAGLYTYPDIAVVCGKAEFEDHDEDTLLNPTVLVDVLSPSTEAYDRGAKFEFYRTLASFSDYLLIAQDRPFIEHFARQPGDRWLLSAYEGLDAVAPIPAIGCELRLADVYDKVTWPAEESPAQRLSVLKEASARYSPG